MLKEKFDQFEKQSDVRAAIWKTIDSIKSAESIDIACDSIANLIDLLGSNLLFIKIADLIGKQPAIRYWSGPTDGVRYEGQLLMETGGCIFHREAVARMRPYLLSDVKRENYSSLIELRFFSEVDKLGYKDIFAVPVVMGRGLSLQLVGLNEHMDSHALKNSADMISHIVAALLLRFPEIGRLFEERRLSNLEKQILTLLAEGQDSASVAALTGYSGSTQLLILQSAQKKLRANNQYELVRLATMTGELDPSIKKETN